MSMQTFTQRALLRGFFHINPNPRYNHSSNPGERHIPITNPLRLTGLAKLSLTRGPRHSHDTANRTTSQLPQPISTLTGASQIQSNLFTDTLSDHKSVYLCMGDFSQNFLM